MRVSALTTGGRRDAVLPGGGSQSYGTSTRTANFTWYCLGNRLHGEYDRQPYTPELRNSRLMGRSRRLHASTMVCAVATTDGAQRKGRGARKVSTAGCANERVSEVALKKPPRLPARGAQTVAQIQHVAAYLALELSAEGLLQVSSPFPSIPRPSLTLILDC